jgi:acetyl esterase/lipase
MKVSASSASTLFSLALLARVAVAADAPVAQPTPTDATAAAPAASTPAATASKEPVWNIPLPLKTGQEIDLFPEGVPGWKDIGPEKVTGSTYSNISNPRLICYPPAPGTPSSGTAVIFCAGGGYVHVAGPGAFNSWLNPLGVTVFGLIYRCQEFGAPAPQQDVMRAVRLLRSHAKELGIDPNKIGVIGNSAGGHVTASAATLYDDAIGKTGIEFDKVSARPDFAVLNFAVLTMEAPNASAASKAALLGRNPTQEQIDQYSVEKHVTPNTPPIFIVHSEQDTTVKEENDLMFYAALRKAGVRAELHLYPDATHGSGLDANFGPTALWQKLCTEWMRWNGWIPTSDTSMMRIQTRGATGGATRGAAGARGAGRGGRGGPAAATAGQ